MRCDVIAKGIIDAASELHMKIPIVVRLQGELQDHFKFNITLHKMISPQKRDLHSGGSRFSRSGAWTSGAALFSKNVCENERIGFHRGGGGACAGHAP